jgi:hypothetical protein
MRQILFVRGQRGVRIPLQRRPTIRREQTKVRQIPQRLQLRPHHRYVYFKLKLFVCMLAGDLIQPH